MNIHRSAHVHDTRREQRKEATTRSGATAPTERHCADQARHTKGSKTKSPFCVVLKTYHLTGNHHKTCLKHSNFLNRKLCVQLLPTWNTMATARGQGTEGKTKHAKTRWDKVQNTAITTCALAWLGVIQNCVQFIKSPDSAAPMGFASFSRGYKSGSTRKQGDCCIEPNCSEWNARQHKMRNKYNKINRKTLREERKTTTWITKHGSRELLKTDDKWRMC